VCASAFDADMQILEGNRAVVGRCLQCSVPFVAMNMNWALKFVELFNTWLKRSGDCPLPILPRAGHTSQYNHRVCWEMPDRRDHDPVYYAEAVTKVVASCFHDV